MFARFGLVVLDLCVLSTLILSGCASPLGYPRNRPPPNEEDFNDPLEDTNRKIFEFNQVVDRNVLLPVRQGLPHRAAPTPCAIHCVIF